MANAYWENIGQAFKTLSKGLKLTFRHFKAARKSHRMDAIMHPDYFDNQEGIATIQYPHETLPVPDNGRYRLHNEIDDCIVCDKCAKICPVDCIDIEAIRSPEVFGTTSDGTAKRIYAAKFDIDMGKCCFCGLCTTVCPTECLTMTKTYDFSEYDIEDHNYEFATMTPLEILEKQKAWDDYQQIRKSAAVEKKPEGTKPSTVTKARPVLKPKSPSTSTPTVPKSKKTAKPVIKPKPIIRKKPPSDE